MSSLSSSVVIATRNRPEALRECLLSIFRQTRLPCEVIIVDSSVDNSTQELAGSLAGGSPFPLLYQRSTVASAAVQRNRGAEASQGDLIFFLDDDVELEPDYVAEIVRVFEDDPEARVGGVTGIINGTSAASPSRLNRFLLRLLGAPGIANYGGRLVGPAICFYPEDRPDCVQRVDWLNGVVTYRREAFLSERFWETFSGYSFMEDLHLSARVGRKYRLMNTTRARLNHRALGGSHTDWAAFGESMVVNRHAITVHVLQQRRVLDYARIVAYELLYCTAGEIKNSNRSRRIILQMLWGKLRGVGKLAVGKSPHRSYFDHAPGGEGAAGPEPSRAARQVRKTNPDKAVNTRERPDAVQ